MNDKIFYFILKDMAKGGVWFTVATTILVAVISGI
jgi:hypothetical protein